MTTFGVLPQRGGSAYQRMIAAGEAFAAQQEANRQDRERERRQRMRRVLTDREAEIRAFKKWKRRYDELPTLENKMRAIARAVALKHKVPFAVLMGRDRDQQASLARREAYWRMSTELRLSMPRIGRFFGRDHTTVLDALQRYARSIGAAP